MHASAVLVGARAVLIRGPSGAGKSRLALELIQAAQAGGLLFARLVGDDRVHLEAAGGRLLVRPAQALAGLIEVRGLGIVRLRSRAERRRRSCGRSGRRAPNACRKLEQTATEIEGIRLPRLAVAAGSGLAERCWRCSRLRTAELRQAANRPY